MGFLDEDYLLENRVAKELFSEVKNLPIIDLHTHADIVEIVKNKGWNDIWEAEVGTDHYVWQLMRRRGVQEEKITGNATNKAKWLALAKIFPELAGNPTYEWIHLDLKRRFGIDKIISSDTAEEIWDETSSRLKGKDMLPQKLLKEMKVEVLCTTDNPTSSLEYHEKAKEEIDSPMILPTWRPDKAMKIESDLWKDFVDGIGKNTDEDTSKLSKFLTSLKKTHDFFDKHGCIASDHGIQKPYSHLVTFKKASNIHKKAYNREELSKDEINDYKSFMLLEFGKMNQEKDWITQLHIGSVRDYRNKLYKSLGPDSGGDISTQNIDYIEGLKNFLNEFDGSLKIVIYCLDPTHLPTVIPLIRAFSNLNIGAPWWFNDSPFGITMQLKYISSADLLYNHMGMVSDSRKLMSYGSRTEVFRRVLCNIVSEMVNMGQIPRKVATDLVVYVSYKRVKEFVSIE